MPKFFLTNGGKVPWLLYCVAVTLTILYWFLGFFQTLSDAKKILALLFLVQVFAALFLRLFPWYLQDSATPLVPQGIQAHFVMASFIISFVWNLLMMLLFLGLEWAGLITANLTVSVLTFFSLGLAWLYRKDPNRRVSNFMSGIQRS